MTSIAIEKIKITSESDFVSFVSGMLERKDLDSDKFIFPDIEFIGWPTIDIHVKGDPNRYSSSLTTSMLFGMADFTDSIYRAFSVFRHSTSNLTNLTEDDKKSLDIVYHVSKGSTKTDGTSDKIINGALKSLNNLVKKMNGRQALGLIVALTIAAGTVGWHWISEYYETQRHDNKTTTELVDKSTRAVVDSQKAILDALTHGQTKESKEILQFSEEGQQKLLKKLASDNTVTNATIGDRSVDRDELNTMTARQKVERIKEEKISSFVINGMNWTGSAGQDLSLTAINQDTGESITLKTAEGTMLPDELTQLSSAWTSRSEIKIKYLEVQENGKTTVSQFISIEQ